MNIDTYKDVLFSKCCYSYLVVWDSFTLGVQSAHILAMAVQKLFPDAQVTIGPWIEKGFFYDFDMKEPFTEKDLKKIKKEMVGVLFFHFYWNA